MTPTDVTESTTEPPEELWPAIDPLEAERAFRPEFLGCRDLLAVPWVTNPARFVAKRSRATRVFGLASGYGNHVAAAARRCLELDLPRPVRLRRTEELTVEHS